MKRSLFVLVLLFFILLLFGNCSLANSVNITNGTQFNYKGNYVEFFDEACKQLYGIYPEDIDWYTTTSYNKLTNIYEKLGNYETWNVMAIELNDRANDYDDMSVTIFSTNTNGYYLGKLERSKKGIMICSYDYYSSSVNSNFPSSRPTNTIALYKVLTNFTASQGQYYKAIWNTIEEPSMNLKFIPSSTTIKNIQGVNFYIYKFNRNLEKISVGELYNSDDFSSVIGSLYQFVDNNNFTYFNQYSHNTVDGEQVLLETNLLYYHQGYAINFIDGDYETPFYYLYFIPYNEDINNFSGDIIYFGNDNNNIVPIQNAINNQYNVNSGELAGIFDNNLFPSGDLSAISSAIKFDNYTNNYFDLLYNFYRNIITTLTSSGNVTLNLSFRNWSMTLNSSDFFIPENPIKSLVRIILIVWCVYLIYQDLDKQYRHIREINVTGFLHDTDIDYHMFL